METSINIVIETDLSNLKKQYLSTFFQIVNNFPRQLKGGGLEGGLVCNRDYSLMT
jgi:hypothetical protein